MDRIGVSAEQVWHQKVGATGLASPSVHGAQRSQRGQQYSRAPGAGV
jgi:hypothetical protein